ncbi:MAG: hypothetical protein QF654_03375 [Alphaproteobacteria bacterium]|jgi:hypothetical protein|nr:hypothetical protein [Alphaproteobacteria bacterium]
MSRIGLTGILGILLAGFLIAIPATALSDHLGRSQVIGGMTVHLGLMPVGALRGDPNAYPAHDRTKLPPGADMHHVMLALFDNKTGERITDAAVTASVAPLAFSGLWKPLGPTSVDGKITYCNYFRISPKDMYVIKADIRLPGSTTVHRTEFVLKPHRGGSKES